MIEHQWEARDYAARYVCLSCGKSVKYTERSSLFGCRQRLRAEPGPILRRLDEWSRQRENRLDEERSRDIMAYRFGDIDANQLRQREIERTANV